MYDIAVIRDESYIKPIKGILAFRYNDKVPLEYTLTNCFQKITNVCSDNWVSDLKRDINLLNIEELYVCDSNFYLNNIRIKYLYNNCSKCSKCELNDCSVAQVNYILKHYFKQNVYLKCVR